MAASRYSPHPAIAYQETILRNLPKTTGRSLEEWLALVKAAKPATEKAAREWLKAQHGLGGTTASCIAEQAMGPREPEDPEALVAAQYADRPALRPLYEALLELGFALGKDVKACPCKTFVPLYRDHVVAQIRPTTKSRIDLGLALGALPAGGRLIDTGGLAKKDRITHRIEVKSPADLDAELKSWLLRAYELDA